MAKGQYLSAHQKGIVKRYYEHADSIAVTTLSEIVSELAMGPSPAAAGKLWTRAQTALVKAGVDAGRAADLCTKRDVKQLAEAVGALWNTK